MYHTETKTSRFCLLELQNQIDKIGVSKPEMFRMNAPRDRRLCIQKGGSHAKRAISSIVDT